MAKSLKAGRREEILDGVIAIISERGFADTTIADIARDLHCSASTLYKMASNKDSLIVLAIGRWAEITFEDLDARAKLAPSPSESARAYFKAAAERLRPISLAFVADTNRFESTRAAWETKVATRFISGFVELVQRAEDAGEVRPVNKRFLAELLDHMGAITRNERVLSASGLTREEAFLEVERIVWEGIRKT